MKYSTFKSVAVFYTLSDGTPSSLVRLGDGEIQYFNIQIIVVNRVKAVLSRAIDGGNFKRKTILEFKSILHSAVCTSDVIELSIPRNPIF